MRIDSGSTPPAAAVAVERGGDTTQLRRYLRAVRRRWPVLVVFCLIGALAGWVSTPSAQGALVDDATFYQATHTIVADLGNGSSNSSGSNSSNTINLEQAAFLANKGEVASQVADQLGLKVEDVASNVTASSLGNAARPD